MKTVYCDYDETLLLCVDKRTHKVEIRNETESSLDLYVTPLDKVVQSPAVAPAATRSEEGKQ